MRRYIRLTAETGNMAVNSPVDLPVTLTHPDTPVILRTRQQAVQSQVLPAEEYRLVAKRVVQLFQTAFREHST